MTVLNANAESFQNMEPLKLVTPEMKPELKSDRGADRGQVPVSIHYDGFEADRYLSPVSRGDGDGGNDSLAGLNLWEGNAQTAVFRSGSDDALQGSAITCLCPRIKVIDDGLAIYSDIKNTKSFVVVGSSSIFPMPGFSEIEFDAIFTIRHGEIIP